MPEFKLRAPASEGTTEDDIHVTGDPTEAAQLRARGYTDVADEADDRPVGNEKHQEKQEKAKPPRPANPSPGVELRQPEGK